MHITATQQKIPVEETLIATELACQNRKAANQWHKCFAQKWLEEPQELNREKLALRATKSPTNKTTASKKKKGRQQPL